MITFSVSSQSYDRVRRFLKLLKQRGIQVSDCGADGGLHFSVPAEQAGEVQRLARKNNVCLTAE